MQLLGKELTGQCSHCPILLSVQPLGQQVLGIVLGRCILLRLCLRLFNFGTQSVANIALGMFCFISKSEMGLEHSFEYPKKGGEGSCSLSNGFCILLILEKQIDRPGPFEIPPGSFKTSRSRSSRLIIDGFVRSPYLRIINHGFWEDFKGGKKRTHKFIGIRQFAGLRSKFFSIELMKAVVYRSSKSGSFSMKLSVYLPSDGMTNFVGMISATLM